MIKIDTRELKQELLNLESENKQVAAKTLRTVIRLTAQYIVRSHTSGARHTPAYTGNLLSNWQLKLGGAQADYRPLQHYLQRKPLAGESLRYDPLHGYADVGYQTLAGAKHRELSSKAYDIVWNSRVTLANVSPYQVDDYGGTVSGVSDISGKFFRVGLRPENAQAVTESDIYAFALGVLPHVIQAVLEGHSHITYKTLSERIA